MAEVAAANISNRFVGVEYDSSSPPKIQTPSNKGGEVIGIVESSVDQDENVSVLREFGEFTKIKAGESISEGDLVGCDTDGKGITADAEVAEVGVAFQDMETDEEGTLLFLGPEAHVRGQLSSSVGSESSNTIPISYQMLDAAQHDVIVGLYEDQGGDTGFDLVSDASGTGQDLSVGSNGTAQAGGTSKRLVARTDSSGALDINVNDNSGSLSGDLWVVARPFDSDRMYVDKVTFA